jgi:hypothetical protein
MTGALGACTARQSFDFVLEDGGAKLQVNASAEVTGDVTNTGFLTLDDGSWVSRCISKGSPPASR